MGARIFVSRYMTKTTDAIFSQYSTLVPDVHNIMKMCIILHDKMGLQKGWLKSGRGREDGSRIKENTKLRKK